MKNKIRQILREETSEFDPKMLNALYQYMNFLTKDYVWYHHTPRVRISRPGTIWLINPETKKWALELDKKGKLLVYYNIYPGFKRYFNMEEYYDFQGFIKLWVEDVLNREVSEIYGDSHGRFVEDILKNGEELK